MTGKVWAEQEVNDGGRQGQPIGLRDTLIAAIAITRGCNVATHNRTHFSRISELEIITP